jgi:hypothetical protein
MKIASRRAWFFSPTTHPPDHLSAQVQCTIVQWIRILWTESFPDHSYLELHPPPLHCRSTASCYFLTLFMNKIEPILISLKSHCSASLKCTSQERTNLFICASCDWCAVLIQSLDGRVLLLHKLLPPRHSPWVNSNFVPPKKDIFDLLRKTFQLNLWD